jgi:hypothetical protein
MIGFLLKFFRKYQHLIFGDSENLKMVASMIKDSSINSKTHLKNKGLEKYIIN